MKRKKISEAQKPFVERIRQLEERHFGDQLHEEDRSFMKSGDRWFWHFRPSHHAATGLITQEDVALLATPGKRLLSVGAYPAFLERLLPALGVPVANILIADKDPAVLQSAEPLQAVTFDANDAWPETGTFDRIIFPESLCVSIGEKVRETSPEYSDRSSGDHPTDALETSLLTALLRQALQRLRPGGIIRANGPMSHPKIIRSVEETLKKQGIPLRIDYRRFFLTVT